MAEPESKPPEFGGKVRNGVTLGCQVSSAYLVICELWFKAKTKNYIRFRHVTVEPTTIAFISKGYLFRFWASLIKLINKMVLSI